MASSSALSFLGDESEILRASSSRGPSPGPRNVGNSTYNSFRDTNMRGNEFSSSWTPHKNAMSSSPYLAAPNNATSFTRFDSGQSSSYNSRSGAGGELGGVVGGSFGVTGVLDVRGETPKSNAEWAALVADREQELAEVRRSKNIELDDLKRTNIESLRYTEELVEKLKKDLKNISGT